MLTNGPARALALLSIAALILAYLVQPFVVAQRADRARRRHEAEPPIQGPLPTADLRRRADLLAQRSEIYQQVKVLERSFVDGDLLLDDFIIQRADLIRQAVVVLEDLDAIRLPAGDLIEVAVRRLEGTPRP